MPLILMDSTFNHRPCFESCAYTSGQLSENSLREKRKQKLMKANSDARKLQKAQRMEEKRLKEEEALREQEERDRDLVAWSNKIRAQHEVRNQVVCF